MDIVILGPGGQVGGMLIEELDLQQLPFIKRIATVGRSGAEFDWSDSDLKSLTAYLDEINPDVIINAIAYTAVDKAESEPEAAMLVNCDLPSALADWCTKAGALLVHFSTDFVFDGMKQEPWSEWDEPAPLSIYGKTKLAGEKALQSSSAASFTMRTSWVYGETGNNFMKTMIRLGKERAALGVVNDQFGCPTYSRELAKATLQLLVQFNDNKEKFVGKQQLYHLSGSGKTSWFGFAEAIFAEAAQYDTLALKSLKPIPTSAYPTPAIRPSNSVLDCSEINDDYGIEAIDWKVSLREVVQRYYQSEVD